MKFLLTLFEIALVIALLLIITASGSSFFMALSSADNIMQQIFGAIGFLTLTIAIGFISVINSINKNFAKDTEYKLNPTETFEKKEAVD